MPHANEYAPPAVAPEKRPTVRGGKNSQPVARPGTPPPGSPPPAPADAAQILGRLRPGDRLLDRLGKSADDLIRWQRAGFGVCLYRTPDGEILLDPDALLAGLAAHATAVAA